MFKSKIRPILIPQNEHGRLAGTLAAAWGNEYFDRPVFDFQSFVRGVTFHDWHYGPLDNDPIGETSETDWLAIVRRGIEHRFEDPVTDLVAKLHIQRLLGGRESPVVAAFSEQVGAHIAERLPETRHFLTVFQWADTITAFCDMVAFDFSFERPLAREMDVYAHRKDTETSTIRYEIRPRGEIRVDPWPFSMEAVQGLILGYQRSGYPDDPIPEIVPFRVVR